MRVRDFADAWAGLHQAQYGHHVDVSDGLLGCLQCDVWWVAGRPEFAETIHLQELV